ncbi:hypothetical protein FQR65_LT20471 [Abscondita terminalis]|nr:hypothetical protein FQR65_LT20471 [Abscondita terminalis]
MGEQGIRQARHDALEMTTNCQYADPGEQSEIVRVAANLLMSTRTSSDGTGSDFEIICTDPLGRLRFSASTVTPAPGRWFINRAKKSSDWPKAAAIASEYNANARTSADKKQQWLSSGSASATGSGDQTLPCGQFGRSRQVSASRVESSCSRQSCSHASVKAARL